MKCAHCGTDSKKRERQSGHCPACHRAFVFDPNNGDRISDTAFKTALDWVSSDGTVRFVHANLHHAVARRATPPSLPNPLIVGVTVGFIASTAVLLSVAMENGAPWLALVPTLVLVGSVIIRSVARARAKAWLGLPFDTYLSLYRRWEGRNGRPPGLLDSPARERPLSPELAAELESYSFDRAVVCDRADTVDVLVGNDFHFENNCAVLTADGYPKSASPVLKKMLRQNPRIEVFVLHDATPEGCMLAHQIRHDPSWFGGTSARVYDVALRPNQAARMPTLHWRASPSVAEHPALSPDDRTWLSQRRMELAAIRPEQIIKRLFRAMHALPELADDADGGGGRARDQESAYLWSSDATTSDGGGDSFG